MALVWSDEKVGTLKGRSSSSDSTLSVVGIGNSILQSSPSQSVATVNILLDLGGKAMVADINLKYDLKKGVVDSE